MRYETLCRIRRPGRAQAAPPMLMLPLLAILSGCGAKEEEKPRIVVQVKTAPVETATIETAVRAAATVYPKEQANLAARVTAPVRRLLAHKGDEVAAGQIVAELEDRDLAAQRQEAAAAVEDARASLEKTAGGTLPTDIERARGQLATTDAALKQAQKIYDRRQELFKEGAIPGRELLIAETDLARATAEFQVARKSYDLLQNQSRERDLRMAQSRLEQAEARLANAAAQLDYARIRSPFAGNITDQFAYPGDMAKPDAPLFTVMDLSSVVARVQVPDSDAGGVRFGQECAFTPADAPGAQFQGRVSVVNKAVDPARRTIEVWCAIPNSSRALRANVFGSVAIRTGTQADAVVVPLPAVQFVEGTSKGSVLVVDAKHVAHKRDIESGQVSEGRVQIVSGLKPGETVVVEGGYGVPDGTEVAPK